MQCKLSFVASLFIGITTLVAGVVVVPADASDNNELFQRTCGDPRTVFAFLRAFSANATDHFYTTNVTEMVNAMNGLGYVLESIIGNIFPVQESLTVPLYRLNRAAAGDHFYTTSAPEVKAAIGDGYTYEGISGYVYTDSTCGGIPLYRMYNSIVVDHFYTQVATERDSAIERLNYNDEGVAAYILPV